MTAATSILARAAALVGSAVYAVAGSVLGSPPVPPVVVAWPRVVWVVIRGDLSAIDDVTAYATEAGALAAETRAWEDGTTVHVSVTRCEVRA